MRNGENPCIVIVDQFFEIATKKLRRTGFIPLANLFPDDGFLKPHENTFPGPVADRKRILGAVKTQLVPIFLVLKATF